MSTKLIKLSNGTLVEVEVPPDQPQQISGGLADEVDKGFEKLTPLLTTVSENVAEAWEKMSEKVDIEQVEVEIGLSFEAEGNIYITKAKSGANLRVNLVLKPKE